jgi:hypothetical protein
VVVLENDPLHTVQIIRNANWTPSNHDL